jgi:hypothetical protein
MLCPKCKHDSAHRSHRAGLKEHLVGIAGYEPYRCRRCQHRFLSVRHPAPEPAAPGVRSVEREIAATQGHVRWRRRRRDLLLYGSALLVFGVVLYFLTREPSMGGG